MKKIVSSIIIFCVIATASMVYFLLNKTSSQWQHINMIDKYSNILDDPITKITLRTSIDSAQWVVFDDSDLIKQWEICLKNLEIKRDKSVSNTSTMNGGTLVANIHTNTAEFIIYIQNDSDKYLQIDDSFYKINNSTNIPFFETYDIAITRHGFTTPWN